MEIVGSLVFGFFLGIVWGVLERKELRDDVALQRGRAEIAEARAARAEKSNEMLRRTTLNGVGRFAAIINAMEEDGQR